MGPLGDYPGHRLLAGILRYDHKLASYKIALIRALNDVVLAFPDVLPESEPVAVPLRLLAEFWLAYYWPFMDEQHPVYQAPRSFRDGTRRQDIAFRDAIENLRTHWKRTVITVRPSDGYFLINEMRLTRRGKSFPSEVVQAFDTAVQQIANVIGKNPVRYAGQGEWQVFPRPAPYRHVDGIAALPGTRPEDQCIVVSGGLWRALANLSPWVEALCLHQWCLFLETVDQGDGDGADRGKVYSLLTDHPENRRPLTWERNQVDILMMEGTAFTCPWTRRVLSLPGAYDLEHLIPITVYPVNELWNLVPADRRFNQHVKRDRLPTDDVLRRAEPALAETYSSYLVSKALAPTVCDDSRVRFVSVDPAAADFPLHLASAVSTFVARVRDSRGVPTFG
jgi:hypothetical protein